MLQNNFLQRKKDILSKLDKSSKKIWDLKIINLCDKINKNSNYYTTSSCSGRIVLMLDSEKKEEGLFIWISHDLINLKELKEVLEKIALSPQPSPQPPALKIINNKKNLIKNKELIVNNKQLTKDSLFKFKQEPCILHVACEKLEGAQILLNKAKLAGWKKSGIIAFGKRFICELNSTEKIEFPIIKNKKLLVDDEFLKLIVEKSNANLKKCWEKIEKLEKIV